MYFTSQKRNRVRKDIIPGNSKTLWKAVRNAKDMNTEEIPKIMHLNGQLIDEEDLAEKFAEHFEMKVNNLVRNDFFNVKPF